ELVPGLHQRLVALAAPVEELEGEAGRVAELRDGRRSEGEDHRIRVAGEARHDAPRQRVDAVLRPGPFPPVAQLDEADARVLAAAAEAEARDGEDRGDDV